MQNITTNMLLQDYEVVEEGFKLWNLGLTYYSFLTLLVIFSLFCSFYLIKNIYKDLKSNFINSIAIPILGIPIFFYYFLPTVFITLCTTNNLCFSKELASGFNDFEISYYSGNPLEKFIFIKYYSYLIISIIGFYLGLRIFKKFFNKKLPIKIKKIFNKFNLEEIRISNLHGKVIFLTFMTASIGLIFFKVYTLIFKGSVNYKDLYYVSNFTRIYSYYDFLIYPPAFLISFGITKFKDTVYLIIIIFTKAFVIYFCLGRTFESFYLGTLSLFLLNSAYYHKLNFSLLHILFNRKFKFLKFSFLIFISNFIFMFITKFIELIGGLTEKNILNNQPANKILGIYQILGNLLGAPKMIYKHFINSSLLNSINIDNYNVIFSQFYTLIYPKYINTFLPDNFLLKFRHLSDYLLESEIKEVGGTTFGSAFGLYSYGNPLLAGTFILLFSSLNFFIFYFLTNKIQLKLSSNEQDYSIRNYLFICTSLPFKSTWGGSLFPVEFIWIYITYLIIKSYSYVITNKNL